jgi:hypothetical protein
LADRIVGFRESDWPAARDAINQVRRGGLEHPFHRRRGPVLDSAPNYGIAQWHGPNLLGTDDTTGVSHTGSATITNHLIFGVASTDDAVTVSGAYLRTVVLPGDFIWVIEGVDDIYYAIAGGVVYLDGTYNDDGTMAADVGGGTLAVGLVVDRCGSHQLVDGMCIKTVVRYNALDGLTFEVIDSGCPP